jgi:phosphomethylpyrimidine synthase
MARARRSLDWEGMFAQSLDPEKARAYRARGHNEDVEGCSMCGAFCTEKKKKG